jgi:hypothetical protein
VDDWTRSSTHHESIEKAGDFDSAMPRFEHHAIAALRSDGSLQAALRYRKHLS